MEASRERGEQQQPGTKIDRNGIVEQGYESAVSIEIENWNEV